MTKTGSSGDRKSSDKQPSGKAGRKSTGGGGGGGGTKSAKHGHPTKASSSGQTGDRTHNSSSSAVAAGAKSAGTAGQSRSYPRGVGLDFRKLAGLTLVSYIDHHGAFGVVAFCCLAFRCVELRRVALLGAVSCFFLSSPQSRLSRSLSPRRYRRPLSPCRRQRPPGGPTQRAGGRRGPALRADGR